MKTECLEQFTSIIGKILQIHEKVENNLNMIVYNQIVINYVFENLSIIRGKINACVEKSKLIFIEISNSSMSWQIKYYIK